MSGGKRSLEQVEIEREFGRVARPPLRLPTVDERATADALARFKHAMRFRRRVNRQLRRLGLTFAEWRVLEATSRLIETTGDAVSHLDVSNDMDLDEASISRLMTSLSRAALVDHDIDNWNYSLRVRLTEKGDELVALAYGVVASVVRD
jgi:DNA-binding MarR family transcriptional regulator